MPTRFRPSPAAVRRLALGLAASGALAGPAAAWPRDGKTEVGSGPVVAAQSELRDLIDRAGIDRAALQRRYPVDSSPERAARLKRFFTEWSTRLGGVAFQPLGVEGRIDYVLLRNRIDYELRLLERDQRQLAEAAPLLPFADTILSLNDARIRMDGLEPVKAATTLDGLAKQIETSRKAVDPTPAAGRGGAAESKADAPPTPKPAKLTAFRAQEQIRELKQVLESWHGYYSGYDPIFTWWAAAPYKKVVKELDAFRTALREKVLGIKADEDEPIVGTPIGRDALVADLASEFIPYTPEDL